jgi:nucleoside-diphosphate-sugar epimerase
LSWNGIFTIIANTAGVQNPDIIHVPSDVIAAFDPHWGAGLLGDKSHSMIFDNNKIKRLVPDFACRIPFSEGAREILDWYNADSARRIIDEPFNRMCDTIIEGQMRAWPRE